MAACRRLATAARVKYPAALQRCKFDTLSRREVFIRDWIRKLSFFVCSSICSTRCPAFSSKLSFSSKSCVYNSILAIGVFVWWEISLTRIFIFSLSSSETAKIFARFYRSPAVSGEAGVGIGLYLAREILSREGGYIKVDSCLGKGSRFSVFLPKRFIPVSNEPSGCLQTFGDFRLHNRFRSKPAIPCWAPPVPTSQPL